MPTPPKSIEAQGGLAVHIGQERYDYLRDNLDAIENHIVNVNALARGWGVSKGTLWRWLKILRKEIGNGK